MYIASSRATTKNIFKNYNWYAKKGNGRKGVEGKNRNKRQEINKSNKYDRYSSNYINNNLNIKSLNISVERQIVRVDQKRRPNYTLPSRNPL